MAGIKETPTNFRVYYTSMKKAFTQKREEAIEILKDLEETLKTTYESVSEDFKLNKSNFPINLEDYEEYKQNQYIDGTFLRVAKGVMINRKGDYELVGRNFDIYRLAKTQKDIIKLRTDLKLYDKLLDLNLKEYNKILKLFYTKVQEKLILEGAGYVFENNIGWVCINRCFIKKARPHIDYKATKERKAQLRAEGKRIYNKEEAEWCAANGLEYKAEDGRVFQNIEYFYEVPLIGCKVPNCGAVKFQTADYRGRSVRGKRNEELLKECNNNKNKICELDVDIRTKLYLCLEADKTLYTKFIRNEDQKSSDFRSTNR